MDNPLNWKTTKGNVSVSVYFNLHKESMFYQKYRSQKVWKQREGRRNMFCFHPRVFKGRIYYLVWWLLIKSNFVSPSRKHLTKPEDVYLLMTGRNGAPSILWIEARAVLNILQCTGQPCCPASCWPKCQ